MKILRTIVSVLVISVLAIFLLAASSGCFSGLRVGYVGNNVGNQISATYQLYDGTQEKVIKVDEGQTILFSYTSVVEKGTLTIEVRDTDKDKIGELETNTAGTQAIMADKTGDYRLIIKGDDTKGSFDVSWEVKAHP